MVSSREKKAVSSVAARCHDNTPTAKSKSARSQSRPKNRAHAAQKTIAHVKPLWYNK
jgi:hypothetical protein